MPGNVRKELVKKVSLASAFLTILGPTSNKIHKEGPCDGTSWWSRSVVRNASFSLQRVQVPSRLGIRSNEPHSVAKQK